ncbi:unnamed protein product [Aspergillus oryzae]|nr:unnamed protein product [Aspergillus oryzae]
MQVKQEGPRVVRETINDPEWTWPTRDNQWGEGAFLASLEARNVPGEVIKRKLGLYRSGIMLDVTDQNYVCLFLDIPKTGMSRFAPDVLWRCWDELRRLEGEYSAGRWHLVHRDDTLDEDKQRICFMYPTNHRTVPEVIFVEIYDIINKLLGAPDIQGAKLPVELRRRGYSCLRTTSSAFDVTRKRTLKEAGLRTEEHTNMVGIYLDIDPWTNPQDPEDVILASRRELERRMTVAEARYANPRGKPPNHRIRVYWVFPSEAQTAEEVFKEAWIYNMAFEEILERGKVFGFPVLLDGCCVVDILRTENRGKMENVSVADVGHCSWEDFLSKVKPAFPDKDNPGTYVGF